MLQSVSGSIVKPKETPQRPGREAMAVAFGLKEVTKPMKHLHTTLL